MAYLHVFFLYWVSTSMHDPACMNNTPIKTSQHAGTRKKPDMLVPTRYIKNKLVLRFIRFYEWTSADNWLYPWFLTKGQS